MRFKLCKTIDGGTALKKSEDPIMDLDEALFLLNKEYDIASKSASAARDKLVK